MKRMIFLVGLAGVVLMAQRYDPAAEVTVKGAVTAVTQHAHKGLARQGIHFTLKADQAAYDVHLGPSTFLNKLGLAVAEGDTVEVTGAKAEYQGSTAILARQVRKGDQVFELRSKDGIPLWSGGRRKGGGR